MDKTGDGRLEEGSRGLGPVKHLTGHVRSNEFRVEIDLSVLELEVLFVEELESGLCFV